MRFRQAANNLQAVAFAHAGIVVTAAGGGAFCRHERLRTRQLFIRINHQINDVARHRFPANLQQQRLILRRSDGYIGNTPTFQPHHLCLPALSACLSGIYQRPGNIKRFQHHWPSAAHQRQRRR